MHDFVEKKEKTWDLFRRKCLGGVGCFSCIFALLFHGHESIKERDRESSFCANFVAI